MSSSKSNIVVNVIDKKCVVTVPQDVTEQELQGLFEQLINSETSSEKYIFDLSGVGLMDETEFIALQNHIHQHIVMGRKAVFCGVRPELAAYLAFIEAIDGNIKWFSNLEAALNEI